MSETDLLNRITRDSKVCHGKPTIRGMRIRVQDVLSMLAGGMSHAEILRDFPYLEKEDILACLVYAAKLASGEPLSPKAA